MGFTNNVVDGNIILAAWGNEIRDRTAQVFATAAERDSQWAAPPNGALAVTLDTGRLWRRLAAKWVPDRALVTEGAANSGQIGVTATGYVDTIAVALGAAPTAVVVTVNAVTYFGFASSWVNGQADVIPYANPVSTGGTPICQAPTAQAWAPLPVTARWLVANGADMGFKSRYNLAQAAPTGNNGWYDARLTYTVTAQ